MQRSQLSAAVPTLAQSLPIVAGVARWCAWLTAFFTFAAVAIGILVSALFWLLPSAKADEAVIYSVYQNLDMGDSTASETAETAAQRRAHSKDFFVSLGSLQGVREGSVLQVSRKMATFDLLSEKLYREVTFPIGTLKVIHTESGVAIARLDKLMPSDKTPAFSPRAIMVGDLVRRIN